MNSATSIAASGLKVSSLQLQAAAYNIANQASGSSQRVQARLQQQTGGGVEAELVARNSGQGSLEQDLVALLAAHNATLANLAVFKRGDDALGQLLDTTA